MSSAIEKVNNSYLYAGLQGELFIVDVGNSTIDASGPTSAASVLQMGPNLTPNYAPVIHQADLGGRLLKPTTARSFIFSPFLLSPLVLFKEQKEHQVLSGRLVWIRGHQTAHVEINSIQLPSLYKKKSKM